EREEREHRARERGHRRSRGRRRRGRRVRSRRIPAGFHKSSAAATNAAADPACSAQALAAISARCAPGVRKANDPSSVSKHARTLFGHNLKTVPAMNDKNETTQSMAAAAHPGGAPISGIVLEPRASVVFIRRAGSDAATWAKTRVSSRWRRRVGDRGDVIGAGAPRVKEGGRSEAPSRGHPDRLRVLDLADLDDLVLGAQRETLEHRHAEAGAVHE